MRKNWILPFANILCLIHCVGIGLLSASAPLWLAGLHLEWLEYGLVIFNLVVGVKVFQSLPIPKYRLYLLVAGLSVAFVGLLFEQHSVYHWSIGLTAVYQIITLIQFHNKKVHLDCACPQHELTPKQKKLQKEVSLLLKKWANRPPVPGENPDKIWREFEKDLKNNRFNIPDRDDKE